MPSIKITLELTVRCDELTAKKLLAGESMNKTIQAMTRSDCCKAATFYAWEINPQTQRLDIDAFWGLDDNGQLIELEAPKEGAGDDGLFGMRGRHPSFGLTPTKKFESSTEKKSLPDMSASVLDDRKCGGRENSTKVSGDHSRDPTTSEKAATKDEIEARRLTKIVTKSGLYHKFQVTRVDGSSEPGGKHENCQYFVLDITHDPIARRVLFSYAVICASTNYQLYNDLCRMLENLKAPDERK